MENAEIKKEPGPWSAAGGKETHIGYCRFCGRSRIIMDAEGTDQESWDDQATRSCDCDEAVWASRRERLLGNFEEDLDQLKTEDITYYVKDFLIKLAGMIVDNQISRGTLNIGNGTSVALSMTAGTLHLKITKKETMEMASGE